MSSEILAETTLGPVCGRERSGALLFAGIPFAAPPVGELRFRAPQPHPGWSDVRPALRFGPGAPQLPGEGLTAAPTRWDEDCLTLNVCTPALDHGARPVIVWIHGGAFRTGKGGIPWYDGASFARRGDVITVTVNYRLGAMGFAHLGALDESEGAPAGVGGILDQIAALEWVRENIAAFGGDPQRVTIAGESAGAMSVGTLLGCPRAAGLFHGAVAQSGAAHNVVSGEVARAVGAEWVRQLEKVVGARLHDLASLQALPVEPMLEAQQRVQSLLESGDVSELGGVDVSQAVGMPFAPAVDGATLPCQPLEAIRGGLSADVNVLLGTNRHETTLFHAGKASPDGLERVARRLLGNERASRALDTYRASRPGASHQDLLVALTTDHMFRVPAVRLAEALVGAGGRCFPYLFTWPSRAFEGRLGATHALEIPFVFHSLAAPGVDVFLGEGPLPVELADAVHAAWIAFLQRGDPSAEATGRWPAYDLERRPVMELGDRLGLLEDPDPDERNLWDGII